MSIREPEIVSPWDQKPVCLKRSGIFQNVRAKNLHLIIGVESGQIFIDDNWLNVGVKVTLVITESLRLMVMMSHCVSEYLYLVTK